MSAAISRRDLLRASLAVGGVFFLEIGGLGCEPAGLPPPVQPSARPGDFVPSAWIRITPDDQVIFTLDRVEMGQGTMTSHAQLVADELEINPARFIIELAGANVAYDNQDAQVRMQVTGGSTSTKASFEPLRRAGAVAREMLKRVAARRFSAKLEDCKAEEGTIVHVPSGRRLRYGELATEAAAEPVPEVTLKADNQHTWIGKSVTRLDARMKVDGSAKFGIDVNVPGMLNAVLLRPPRLGAEVSAVDDRAARSMPGVVDVLRIPQGVAVVAARHWQARRAADAVKVTWSGGAEWVSSEAIRAMYLDRAKQPAKMIRAAGNVERAEKEAAQTIEAVYELPYLAHATMEPQNATVHFTGDRCEIWCPTQGPALVREVVRRVTGLPYESIVVHQTLLGGGFGRRGVHDFLEEALQIALKINKPIKLVWTREDDMRFSPYRPAALSFVRGTLDARGAIASWNHRIVCQSVVGDMGGEWVGAILPASAPLALKLLSSQLGRGIGGGSGLDPTSTEGAANMAYEVPNLQFEHAPMRHPIPVAAWRSVGNSHNVFVTESFFDELARKAGKDPLAARRALLTKSPRHLAVLNLAAEKAGWGKPLPEGHFHGVAQALSFDTFCAEVAEVSVKGGEVKVHKITAAVDCGKVVNPDLVKAQIESGIIFGLGAALRGEITWKKGGVEQSNFHDYEPLRMRETPEIEVHIVPSKEAPTGVGEPGLPPVAPAVANAILAATGKPVRMLPFTRGLAAKEPAK